MAVNNEIKVTAICLEAVAQSFDEVEREVILFIQVLVTRYGGFQPPPVCELWRASQAISHSIDSG